MHKYLKPKQHYIDLYDRHTVEYCREREKSFLAQRDSPLPEDEKVSKEEAARAMTFAINMFFYVHTGKRYLNKEKVIQEWMQSDQEKDELLECTNAPEDIRCLTCRSIVEATFKELMPELDKKDRVLFMYDCPNKCVPRRAFFSDGEEWRAKPNPCPRCGSRLDQEDESTERKIQTKYSCQKCTYNKTDEHIFTKKQSKIDEHFSEDRDRFCLTEEAGKKYVREKDNLERMGEFMKELRKKEEAKKEKLKENPDGFHLEGKGYTCQICKNSMSNMDTWYDKYGLSCLLCRDARRNGIIPDSVFEDKESWYTMHDFDRYFQTRSTTVRKFIRNGKLKARIIPTRDGKEYFEIFLIKDNEGFLPPKPKSHLVTTDDGYSRVEYERADSPFTQTSG